ncbi:MAG: hypothetical protein MJ116_05465 [Lachnospiraceae bacterium]|nr:hypothetical protein [Lachnospiraceae bacterium]
MLQYAVSEDKLVDFFEREHHGNFEFHVPENQCAYLQLSDGREGFFESGDHTIRLDRASALFRKYETVSMFWFNLSDHIELHLSDIVQVMEQMLKSIDPDLKLFAPVDVRVNMDLTVRIEDREKLLQLLFDRQEQDYSPVLEKQWLTKYLENKLHYILEETVNSFKQQSGTGIFNLSGLSEDVEGALIGEIWDLLESMSLELVAARIVQIAPTRAGMEEFQEKESDTLSWYNQVQMDKYSRRKSNQVKKLSRFS